MNCMTRWLRYVMSVSSTSLTYRARQNPQETLKIQQNPHDVLAPKNMPKPEEKSSKYSGFRLSVAPMMDWTDRHCRSFHRVLSRRALLYSEMVTSAAVLHGDRDRLLGFDAAEHPVVHARKAILKGLSPKENRDIPPLNYDLVRRLKRDRPGLTIVLNGGIGGLDAAEALLADFDGVMLGRAAYHDPGLLGEVDARIFGEGAPVTPEAAVEAYLPYVDARLSEGVSLAAMTRHMLGLFQGRRGARAWRRILTVESVRPGAGTEVIRRALAEVSGSGVEAQGLGRGLEAGEPAQIAHAQQ
jgi:tRNA-dihydrouridine synthase